jgi:hypothetical protein
MPFIRQSLISLCGSSTMRQRCSPRRLAISFAASRPTSSLSRHSQISRSDRGCDTRIQSTAVWHPFRRQREQTEHHTELREGHAVNLSLAQHYQTGVFIQRLPAKQTWLTISFSHDQLFAVWSFSTDTFTCSSSPLRMYGNATAGISRFSSWYQTTASETRKRSAVSRVMPRSKVVVALTRRFNALLCRPRERFFLRFEVVIVVFQAKKLFRFSHGVVQLAVTHQHPEIQQVSAVTAGKICPCFLPPRLIFRLFAGSPFIASAPLSLQMSFRKGISQLFRRCPTIFR